MSGNYEVQMGESTEPLPHEQLVQWVTGAHAIVSMPDDVIGEDVFAAAGPQLKIVANYAVGSSNVDLAAAIARHVWVTHTPGVENTAVAELTFGLALALLRGILPADAFVRSGKFTHWDAANFIGRELERSTLGIVGLGQTGSAVATRGRAFGMRVIYHDVVRKEQFEAATGVEYAALDDVFRQADLVTLHLPMQQATFHLVGRERLALMQPTAYLVNLSCGPLVDEAALMATLQAGELAGAALDVYEREPELAAGLTDLPNVLLTPHIGGATRQAREAMGRLVTESVIAALAGRTPPHLVEGTS